jgi:dolichyl-phosphate-mannose-protein mannosyltransferase
LGKYFIALGIWISTHVPLFAPFLKGTSVAITSNIRLFPLSYRWMNALVGSCVPLLVMGLVHTLGRQANHLPNRRFNQSKLVTFAVLGGAFVAIDGLFITESRYALINIYIVFFGLLGHWLWLRASFFWLAGSRRRGHGYRLLAGIALGGAIATKWNALGYVLSLLIWEVWRTRGKACKIEYFWLLFYAIFVPALIYCLIWLPHLSFTQESLGGINLALLSFHRELSNGGHQACAPWFTWPLLIKPIAYWYQESGGLAYTVNNLGNPALWWLASAATFLLLLEQSLRLIRLIRRKGASLPERSFTDNLRAYLLISYAANWLPWMLVGRCTFIYLYMPAAVFSFMVLAWLLSEWLHGRPDDTLEQAKGQARRQTRRQAKIIGWLMLGAIALAFFFWLPLSLGLPLTPPELQLRWWLKSWI